MEQRRDQSETVDKTTRAARPELPNAREKEMIVSACETFIAEVLKPRFLPQIRPTEWNYVIDIHGAWAAGAIPLHAALPIGHGAQSRVRNSTRHSPVSTAWGPDRFDIYWMRHTGKWWRLYVGVTLAEALENH